jgi:MATE family multidrug resistance protein
MIPLGISIGLTVRMGNVLSHSVHKAKLMAAWCMAFTVVVGAVVSTLLYQFRIQIAMLFSNDEEVIQGCKDIWPKLCYYIFVLYIFGINSAILRALGMQWRMAAIIFTCLWVCMLPLIIIFAMHRGGGIDAVWNILPVFYTVMQVLLAASYMTADWSKISRDIQERGRVSLIEAHTIATEATSLLERN